jgi:hypothetical protein
VQQELRGHEQQKYIFVACTTRFVVSIHGGCRELAQQCKMGSAGWVLGKGSPCYGPPAAAVLLCKHVERLLCPCML